MVAILGVRFISKHTHLKMMKNLLQEEDVKSCLLWTCWNVFSWIKLFKMHSFCVFVQSWKISVHSAALDYFIFKSAASESSSVTVLLCMNVYVENKSRCKTITFTFIKDMLSFCHLQCALRFQKEVIHVPGSLFIPKQMFAVVYTEF